MKSIIKLLILSIVLTSAFSTKLRKVETSQVVTGAAIASAVLADPTKFAEAVDKFVDTVGKAAQLPTNIARDVINLLEKIKEYRKTDVVTMVNLTNKLITMDCKDGKSFFPPSWTLRGENTIGGKAILPLMATGTHNMIKCYVYVDKKKFGGEFKMERKATYAWTGKSITEFIRK